MQEQHPPSKTHTAEFTLLTINLLSGAARWQVRREWLLEQIRGLAPDIVAVQEVSALTTEPDPATWLAEALGYPDQHLCWQLPGELDAEAVGLISRLPLEHVGCLYLGGQQRVAQRALVRVGGAAIAIANTHLYWQPGDSSVRLRQAEKLLGWMQSIPGGPPCVIAGDFNGTPETRAVRHIAAALPSAYTAVHGREPEYTFPTPLHRPRREKLLGALSLLRFVRPARFSPRLKNTLDYIFVDPRLRVLDCRLVLDQPSPADPGLYPSDHYGLLARIGVS